MAIQLSQTRKLGQGDSRDGEQLPKPSNVWLRYVYAGLEKSRFSRFRSRSVEIVRLTLPGTGATQSILSPLKPILTILGVPLAIIAITGVGYVLLDNLGLYTTLVDFHYGVFIVALIVAFFLADAIYFSKIDEPQVVSMITFTAFGLFALVVATLVFGIVADAPFSGATASGNWINPFGAFSTSVSASAFAAFCAGLIFDIMESGSVLGAGLGAIIVVLIWHYKGAVLTDPEVKRSVLTLITIGIVWMLLFAIFGVALVKTFTYPPNL